MNRMNEWRRVAQAGKGHDPAWYSVHRRISIYLTWAMLKLGLEANQVSGLMMVLGVAGALLVATPSPLGNALGFVLFYGAPFIFFKHLREGGRLPEAPLRKPSRHWARALRP